jgi:hypothetical protein
MNNKIKVHYVHVTQNGVNTCEDDMSKISRYNKKLRTSDFIGPLEIFNGDSSPAKIYEPPPFLFTLASIVLIFVQASPLGTAKKAQNNIWGQI